MEIVDKAYDIVSFLSSEEKFGMKSQMTRSSTAIPANIAEGSAKKSQRDYSRFIERALGSAFELETHSLIVQRRGWVDEKLIADLLKMLNEGQKMLQSFIKKLDYED